MLLDRIALIVAPAMFILALAGCASTAPPVTPATPASVSQSQALTDSVTAPTGQLLAADVIATWASVQTAASAACTTSMTGASTAVAASDFAQAGAAYDHAQAVSRAQKPGATHSGYPEKTPAVDTSNWCAVPGQLAAAAAASK